MIDKSKYNTKTWGELVKDLPEKCPKCKHGDIIAEEFGKPLPFVSCDLCNFGSEGKNLEIAISKFLKLMEKI